MGEPQWTLRSWAVLALPKAGLMLCGFECFLSLPEIPFPSC